jgi:hemerythrin
MAFFKWNDSFNIGVKELDHQHRTFLEYLNECYEIVSHSSPGTHRIDPSMVENLRLYATTHFNREEVMLKFWTHPDLKRHMELHKYFESQIRELETGLAAGTSRRLESVFEFLRDWFMDHILQEDKKISDLIK